MITFTHSVESDTKAQHCVALPYHQRVKGRLRITTQDGVDAGISVDRGQVLEHGQKLADDTGEVLEIHADAELVSVAATDSPQLFARACYHVGNRHAEVQIDANRLVYLKDHVMDSMLIQLGLTVVEASLPFSPENGAYSTGHAHSDHGHGHGHGSHDHGEHEH